MIWSSDHFVFLWRFMKKNYQLLMDEEINKLDYTPKLLLHVCCAPCSSYVLKTLANHFSISICYYNPNITDRDEYNKRLEELKRFINDVKYKNDVKIIDTEYNNLDFFNYIKGLESELEGGKRCYKCYYLRLNYTAKKAKELGFDYFTTSLSISPYKNAEWLNEIGIDLENVYGVKYLVADFKKKNGYKESIELSKKYNLYRQDYCGCIYSKIERRKHDKEFKNKKQENK